MRDTATLFCNRIIGMSAHNNPFVRGIGEVLGVALVLLSLAWILFVEMPVKLAGRLVGGLAILFLASSAFGQSLFALPAPVATINPSVQNYGSVTLGWAHPTDKAITNYSISYGTNRTMLNNSVGAGYATNVTISGLEQWQTYYFSGLAYHAAGIASEFSNMVTNFIPPRWRVFSYSTMFETPMLAGRTNIIQSSTNGGLTWRNLHTNTAGGMYRIVRTNGAMPTTEIFRVKP